MKFKMSLFDKLELCAIIILTGIVWFAANSLPFHLGLGNIILLLSALLLLQSLIRDLSLLFNQRKKPKTTPAIISRCMCVESTVGITGILLGIALIALPISSTIVMSQTRWALSFFVVTTAGFLIKDFVFMWNPWQIRREKDHMNIIFSWKSSDN